MDQTHDQLAAIGEADRVDLRAVAVETAHQKIDGGLGEGDVVDIGAPRRGGVDDPGVVPVPFVSVQVGDNGPGLCPDVVERVRGERANRRRSLHRAVKDQHHRYRARTRLSVANDGHCPRPAADLHRLP